MPTIIPIPHTLASAIRRGREQGSEVASTRPGAIPTKLNRAEVRDRVLAAIPPKPTAAQSRLELKQLHQLARVRTPEGIDRARHLYSVGEDSLWKESFASLHKSSPLADAEKGADMLQRALSLTESVTRKAKTVFARPRPFTADETLTTAVRRPTGATSYPSSHSARAFAAATVLGSLWPKAAADMIGLATEVAASRPYAGVHYPSDVAVGAMIGTAVGTFVANGSA